MMDHDNDNPLFISYHFISFHSLSFFFFTFLFPQLLLPSSLSFSHLPFPSPLLISYPIFILLLEKKDVNSFYSFFLSFLSFVHSPSLATTNKSIFTGKCHQISVFSKCAILKKISATDPNNFTSSF